MTHQNNMTIPAGVSAVIASHDKDGNRIGCIELGGDTKHILVMGQDPPTTEVVKKLMADMPLDYAKTVRDRMNEAIYDIERGK